MTYKSFQKEKKIKKVYGMPWEETYCNLTLMIVRAAQFISILLVFNAVFNLLCFISPHFQQNNNTIYVYGLSSNECNPRVSWNDDFLRIVSVFVNIFLQTG